MGLRGIDVAAAAIAAALTTVVGLVPDEPVAMRSSAPALRIASFNIETYPRPRTDDARVIETLVELDADAIALQEIVDADRLRRVLDEVSTRTERRYTLQTTHCGGDGGSFTTAIAWDVDRLRALEVRDYPGLDPHGRDGCDSHTQAGLLAVLADEAAGEQVAVLSVHLSAHSRNFPARRTQWANVLAILADVRERHPARALALGDFNSTGFLGDPAEERDFVERAVARAGYRLLSRDLPCSEYWARDTVLAPFAPSLLDHAVATDSGWSNASVEGYCARLACGATERSEMDPDHFAVSDHCPIIVERGR